MEDNRQGPKSIDSLSPEEIKELRDRFGIDIENGEGLSENLAKIKEIRERIEAIERKALKKLRGSEGPSEGE